MKSELSLPVAQLPGVYCYLCTCVCMCVCVCECVCVCVCVCVTYKQLCCSLEGGGVGGVIEETGDVTVLQHTGDCLATAVEVDRGIRNVAALMQLKVIRRPYYHWTLRLQIMCLLHV